MSQPLLSLLSRPGGGDALQYSSPCCAVRQSQGSGTGGVCHLHVGQDRVQDVHELGGSNGTALHLGALERQGTVSLDGKLRSTAA
jgi:hypothetical protein